MRKRLWLLGLLISLALARPAGAETDAWARDPVLVPEGSPGFVQLVACTVVAHLSCEGEGCTLAVEQVYQWHNRDRLQGATLRLGLSGATVPVSLTDPFGAPINPLIKDAPRPVWELSLGRNESKTVKLAYTRALGSGPFLAWEMDAVALAAWGMAEGARFEFWLPQCTGEDIFLAVEPRNIQFDCRQLYWEYEKIASWAPHQVVLVAPPVWQQLQTLRAQGDHLGLARLYRALQEAARQQKVPLADLSAEILAELQSALAQDPTNLAARQELVQFYRRRAEEAPELRLNYLLLAAQELEQLLKQRPDAEVAQALSRTYAEASSVASASGDPEGALVYLRKAGEVPGAPLDLDPARREDLLLRWALDLAEQGRVRQALTQLAGALSPQMEDALLRYAPSVIRAQTEVALTPADRTVRYVLTLYPPSAAKTLARLQDLARRIEALQLEVSLETAPEGATLSVRVPAQSVAELAARAEALQAALTPEDDLLVALILAPWRIQGLTFETRSALARERHVYREVVDLAPLEALWEQEAQYVNWRQVELRTASATGEREGIVQRLASLALRDQRQAWEQLPSGSYWVYSIHFSSSQAPGASWRLAWNETRELSWDTTIYDWPQLLRLGLALGGGILVFLAILRLLARPLSGKPR